MQTDRPVDCVPQLEPVWVLSRHLLQLLPEMWLLKILHGQFETFHLSKMSSSVWFAKSSERHVVSSGSLNTALT